MKKNTLHKLLGDVTILISATLLCVWVRMESTRTTYKIISLEKKKKTVEVENKQLTNDSLTLRSPKRIEKLANEMGLHFPSENQIIYKQKDLAKR